MPRDGSNQYYQPSPDVVPDTTIASATYNAFVGDVAQDLNHPRPIIAGGTAATNIDDALTNLKAEKASQEVTNYDSHVWLPGSFYSKVGATAAPDSVGAAASAFVYVGTCMIGATPDTIAIEARNISDTQVPGRDYVREKKAGVWGAWASQVATLEATKVNRAGDTMTGGLVVAMPGPVIAVAKTEVGQHNAIYGRLNATARWLISLGESTAETGGNVGSNFALYRYGDSGDYIGAGLQIARNNGDATFPANVHANTFTAAGAATFNGAVVAGGELTGSGNVRSGGSLISHSAHVFFNAAATWYIRCDGANFHSPWGYLWHSGNFNPGAYQPALGFTPVQQGGGLYQAGSKVYIGWDGAGLRSQVDGTDLGRFLFEGAQTGYTSARWVHIADYTHISNAGLVEPHGGCAITGMNIFPALNCTARYRQLQMHSGATGWVAVGYA